jgi:sulfhydrogenase subunit delta
MKKPKVGIFGLTGCAGEQIVILNCEDQLIDIIGAIDIKCFPTAMTKNDEECELDIAFIDGSVAQPSDRESLEKIRKRSKLLIALGTCAVWGGLPAMRNDVPRKTFLEKVFGKRGNYFKSIPAQPLKNFVEVDLSISGCPIEKEQLLKATASLLHGDPPLLPSYAVCTECKMNEYDCVLAGRNELCLGPITVAGCGARCPGFNIPCIGCRGPVDEANIASEIKLLKERGFTTRDIENRLRSFASQAEVFGGRFRKG